MVGRRMDGGPPKGTGTDTAGSGETDVYRMSFDWDDGTTAGVAVLEAIEAFSGKSIQSLEPLQRTIDVDALDRLFADRPNGMARNGGRVAFTVDGCHVSIHGDGLVVVRGAEDAD